MILIEAILLLVVAYIAFAGIYQLILAVSYFITKRPEYVDEKKLAKFAIIVPAHDEELLISSFCESVGNINYPQESYDVFIIADNCSDKTEDICSGYPVETLSRHDLSRVGKGYALEWALDQININDYDLVLVLDADTTVKDSILTELNKLYNNGEHAIQCFIEVPNRNESSFTRLIHLSRTVNDLLYHYSKYKLGLSSYLMGTGMCFSTKLLSEIKWNAFSLSEDWEYYATLLNKGYRVSFSREAVIMQMESCSLQQATSQRLRWASGRFYVVKSLGVRLLVNGIKRRNIVMADGALALLLPNWSLQVNMIFMTLFVSLLLPDTTLKYVVVGISCALLAAQVFIVLAGAYLTGRPMDTLKAILYAPVFLMWKMIIDILCITGLYKGKEWIRTKRHIPK